MTVCNSIQVMLHISKGGHKMTNNLFFVEDVLYWELLDTKQYVNNYTGDVVIHRSVQSSSYLAWNYKTNEKRYVDAKTFRTQLLLFKYFKETRPDYMDELMQDLLDYDLSTIAFKSEHLF